MLFPQLLFETEDPQLRLGNSNRTHVMHACVRKRTFPDSVSGTGILVSFLPPHFRPNTSGSSFKIQKSSLIGIIDGHRPSSVDF